MTCRRRSSIAPFIHLERCLGKDKTNKRNADESIGEVRLTKKQIERKGSNISQIGVSFIQFWQRTNSTPQTNLIRNDHFEILRNHLQPLPSLTVSGDNKSLISPTASLISDMPISLLLDARNRKEFSDPEIRRLEQSLAQPLDGWNRRSTIVKIGNQIFTYCN